MFVKYSATGLLIKKLRVLISTPAPNFFVLRASTRIIYYEDTFLKTLRPLDVNVC